MPDIEKEREAFIEHFITTDCYKELVKYCLGLEDDENAIFELNTLGKFKFGGDGFGVVQVAFDAWQASALRNEEKLEGCVEASVWVATDFLLPDEGEIVLFIDNHNVVHEGFISTDYVDGPYGENGEDFGGNKTLWSSNSNGWELLPDEVKYWMKRPNNPVEAVRGGNHE